MRAPRFLLLLFLAAIAGYIAYVYGSLPENLASVFDASGRAGGYQSKQAFFGVFLGMAAVLVMMFLAFEPILQRLPTSWINVPAREYWLAPERKRATLEDMGERLEWFGLATMLLLLATLLLAVRANRLDDPRMESGAMWILFAAYLGYSVYWLVSFIRAYRPPASSERESESPY